ncbi:mandelate racemase/muconate lactonizing enzyme family protein [Dactylosporangium sp. CA-233914]|uniref:mandelate racemase/muconate lactonizing enzyme family protein n=1 Tax=Dactylosporangium sp. CA-233914 TaxID=3239934 RepID=UPI003D926B44
MRITGCEIFIVTPPLRRAHVWAGNTRRRIGRHAIVRVDTDEGISGWGESPAIPTWGGSQMRYGGETPETVALLVREYLIEAVRGADPRQLGVVHARMDAVVKGSPYAKAVIDIACHDIAGKAMGVPVHVLLGGKHRDGLRITHSLGIMPIEEALAEAEEAVAEGITAFKIKTGVDGERDVEIMRELRRLVGPNVEIRVDGNEGYATVAEAIRVTRRQEEYDLLLCEQPVAGADALAAVARAITAPVMADESAWTTHDILELHRRGAAESFSCYVTKPGGLFQARRQAEIAADLGMYHDIGGSIEFGIGVAANLHLGVATPRMLLPSVCPVPSVAGQTGPRIAGVYYLDDVIAEPITYRDGTLLCPTGPGLGVTVDEERLRRYTEQSVTA